MGRAKQAIVLGAGGHAKVVVSTLRAAGWSVVAAFDDRSRSAGAGILGVPIAGRISDAVGRSLPAVIAIGDNDARRRVANEVMLDWISVIHPSAWIDPSVKIGVGGVVFAGAVVQPDAQIGNHVIVNTGATIDHDCVIGDYTHLAPGVHLAGGVQVGDGAFMGIASSATIGVKVSEWSTVGAGAVVIRDVEPCSIVVGVPARPIGSRNRKSNQ